MECEVVWHGASWREIEPPPPPPVRPTLPPLVRGGSGRRPEARQRVLAVLSDGQRRTIWEISQLANIAIGTAGTLIWRLREEGIVAAVEAKTRGTAQLASASVSVEV